MDWIELSRLYVPVVIRRHVQRYISLTEVKKRWRARQTPLSNLVECSENPALSPVTVGIIRNRSQYHTHYIRACQDMGLPFKVIDIDQPDWWSTIQLEDVGFLVFWPDAHETTWATLEKDRVQLIAEMLDLPVTPAPNEYWMYEDKKRMSAWLAAHRFPCAKTWILTNRKDADRFASTCDLPLIFKTSFGAAAKGVTKVSNRRQLRKIISRAFGSGHFPDGHDRRNREWGFLILQEFLPDIEEWRLVRIGDSYFGHLKGESGGFHSGSSKVDWSALPDQHLLELMKAVTDRGSFGCMSMDVFRSKSGDTYINEIQAVFGASTSVDQMRKDGEPCRFRLFSGTWQLESGAEFARNACANLRLQYMLRKHFGFETSLLRRNNA